MPTYDATELFLREWDQRTKKQRAQFRRAVRAFVADLKAGHGIRASLGVKRYHGEEGEWEFRWGPDGRALFRYGTSPHAGDVHIIWLRIGTHNIYK
jgi:hypothetical protein